jgi:tetratricopeptide (TPR) repeat protein
MGREVIVELLAGDPAAAAEVGAEGCRLLDEQGEKSLLSTAAGRLAQALYALDRLDEADAWAVRAAELGASEDAMTQMLSLQVRGKVLAQRGEALEAESLAREAVALGEKTDMINMQGDAYLDLGEVLVLTGRSDEAVAAFEQAVERYERKGNLASTQYAQARLAEIGAVGRRAH